MCHLYQVYFNTGSSRTLHLQMRSLKGNKIKVIGGSCVSLRQRKEKGDSNEAKQTQTKTLSDWMAYCKLIDTNKRRVSFIKSISLLTLRGPCIYKP